MRPSSLVPCMLVWGLAGFTPLAHAEEKPAPLSVSYTHAGLTEITVKDGKLRYVWHTMRQGEDGKAVEQGSLANYDRHQVDIWLTGKEMKRFRDWVVRRKVFEFEKDYPSASGGRSRGAAFQSGLDLVLGEKKRGISWAGDSKIPKGLGTAISELITLADEIQKSRSK